MVLSKKRTKFLVIVHTVGHLYLMCFFFHPCTFVFCFGLYFLKNSLVLVYYVIFLIIQQLFFILAHLVLLNQQQICYFKEEFQEIYVYHKWFIFNLVKFNLCCFVCFKIHHFFFFFLHSNI